MNQTNKSEYAPVVLFVYNRPWHTKQSLNALANNYLTKESVLYIFADGAKESATATQKEAIEEVRSVIREEKWCKEVHIIEHKQNKGLANSIIEGVTKVVNQYGKIIVLEDDMITSPYFLKFMNESLNAYENQEKVASIHAYIYQIANLPTTFLLKDPGCWGWATWKRGWDLFETDGKKLMKEIKQKKLSKRFDYENAYPYFLMLERQVKGQNDSWAIRWYASLFLKDKLSLYPHQSLVHNIGNDASGTHTIVNEKHFNVSMAVQAIDIQNISIEPNEEVYRKQADYFKANYPKYSLIQEVKWKIKAILLKSVLIRKVINRFWKTTKIEAADTYWKNDYASWQDAVANSEGYDNMLSFARIQEAAIQVKNREAIFERDGKLFYLPEYNWLLMKYLSVLSQKNKDTICLIDFGGALGSTYFQHLWLLKKIKIVSCNVVEQSHFVEFGKKELATDQLHFFETIKLCKQQTAANIVLLSGVLSYLPAPYKIIEEIENLNIQYIIIDRMPFIDTPQDILTVQHVSQQSLYQGSYPCWVFSEQKLKNVLLKKYKILDEQPSFDSIPTQVKGLPKNFSNFKFWILERK